MYGTFLSAQYVEISAGDKGYEPCFMFMLVCTARGTPGQLFGPPENCYPAELPEFGIEYISVGGREISQGVLNELVGPVIAAEMLEAAELEAEESGEFS